MKAGTTSSDHSEIPEVSRQRSARRRSMSSSRRSIRLGLLLMRNRVGTGSDGLSERGPSPVQERQGALQKSNREQLDAGGADPFRELPEVGVLDVHNHDCRRKLVEGLGGGGR